MYFPSSPPPTSPTPQAHRTQTPAPERRWEPAQEAGCKAAHVGISLSSTHQRIPEHRRRSLHPIYDDGSEAPGRTGMCSRPPGTRGRTLIHSLGFLASQVAFQCPGQLPGSTRLTQRLTLLTLSSPASRPLLPWGSSSSWLVFGTLGGFLLIFPSFPLSA